MSEFLIQLDREFESRGRGRGRPGRRCRSRCRAPPGSASRMCRCGGSWVGGCRVGWRWLGGATRIEGGHRCPPMLTVNEIFHSIQGESTFAGEPCVFVRLTACDLRCSWCDTPYAFHEGRKMSIDDVLAEVDRYGCPLVEVTGGEPLLQSDVYPLIRRILDVKCPGSSEAERMDWGNFARLTSSDEVKFVIKDQDDYRYAREIVI